MIFNKISAVIGMTITIWPSGLQDLCCKDSECISENIVVTTAITTGHLGNTNTIDPWKLFTKADADKIMGQSTHLTDSSSKVKGLSSSYLCSYKTDVTEPGTGKTGAVYFLFEQYQQISGAKKRYADVMLANKPHGIEDISDLGDEAYFHTDGTGFYFIMVRKGKNVFNIKVNKIIKTTSLSEFKKTARKIAAAI
ncbi:hypothetical protein [Niabella soli]|uniref:Uncharacterized protein n=1 Tax=Niabella soli DSM 19437 TaxID=929713 RepID=W0F2K7_9BACT|nr:hypothetical protein [Niabella soli]AHF17265.1 hypothetical protein NIASO_04885 [Niabella soli DSM 19437]